MPDRRLRTPADPGSSVLLGLAVLAFLDAIFNDLWTGNGIHGTEGALLVAVSTLLLIIAAGLIAGHRVRGWVRTLFEVLIFLDLLGTALAAYLLEAPILLVLIGLAFIAWVVHLVRPSRTRQPVSNPS